VNQGCQSERRARATVDGGSCGTAGARFGPASLFNGRLVAPSTGLTPGLTKNEGDPATFCEAKCDPFSRNRWQQRGMRGVRRGDVLITTASPMIGAIPIPPGAWRKSDTPVAATGRHRCTAGCNGDKRRPRRRDASSKLPKVRRRTHVRTVVSKDRPTRGFGPGPNGHGSSG
jgi:hypothetical protein